MKLFFVVVCAVALGASWTLSPADALRLCGVVAFVMAVYAWGVSLRNALRGDTLAWTAVVAVGMVISAYLAMSFAALNPDELTWQIQALAAAGATGYMLTLGFINWQRYSYLLELKKVMAYGPAYDPVTRLRSHAKTEQMASEIFGRRTHANEPLGVIVLTIANLYALEQLHGTAAVNSALFLTAMRLKRTLPAKIDVGRLGSDGFLLIMRNCSDTGRLVRLAHDLNRRLHKSVKLTTNPDIAKLESASTMWTAQMGIGAMQIKDLSTSSGDAIAMGCNVSRTAVSYASRVAWFDHSSGGIVELPALQPDS